MAIDLRDTPDRSWPFGEAGRLGVTAAVRLHSEG